MQDWKMDRWKWYWLRARYLVFDNPTSEEKIERIVESLELPPGAKVLEIACGKAEMLCRIADRYGAVCTGVEISPYMAKIARDKIAKRDLGLGSATVHEGRGQDFEAPAGSFDATLCIGATWVFDGYLGTLQALSSWTKPGGTVAVGEPFWTAEPPPEYLASSGMSRDDFGTHVSNFEKAIELGLTPISNVVSNHDDWDRYEAQSWRAVARYLHENPDDSDDDEIRQRNRRYQNEYIRWGRDCLGWAIYVFEKAAERARSA